MQSHIYSHSTPNIMYIISDSKTSFWLSPLKSPAKKRLLMTIGDLEAWNRLGSLGEVKANAS